MLKTDAPRSLDWALMPMPDEDHGSSVLRAYYFGLRKVFSDWRVKADPVTGFVKGGVKGADEHYQRLSEKYGIPLPTPEGVINRIGYEFIRAVRYPEAVAAFKVNVERYPQSANAYDSLAEGYTFNKEFALARVNAEIAVRLGTEAKDPNLSTFKDRLEKLSTGLNQGAK